MKSLILSIGTLLFLSVSGMCQGKKFRDIVGQWEIAGEQNAGASLNIIDSNTIVLTYRGETKKISNIRIDFSKSPAWFDFSAQDSSDALQVKSLVEVGDNVMKWQLFIDEERTPYFTTRKGEILYLKRARSTPAATASSQ
jgi:hypothetical protein